MGILPTTTGSKVYEKEVTNDFKYSSEPIVSIA